MSVESFKKKYLERNSLGFLELRFSKKSCFYDDEMKHMESSEEGAMFHAQLESIRHEVLKYIDAAFIELERK